ncbi:GGDEF domain-containing protein [Deinococcus arboris]|nr:GGDEF domain-containing protein [Deinococcus arboris]
MPEPYDREILTRLACIAAQLTSAERVVATLVDGLSVTSGAESEGASQSRLPLLTALPLQKAGVGQVGTVKLYSSTLFVLSTEQQQALQDLVIGAVHELELQAKLDQARVELHAAHRQRRTLERRLEHARTLDALHTLSDRSLTPCEVALQSARLIGPAIGADWTGLVTFAAGVPRVQAAHRRTGQPDFTAYLGTPGSVTSRLDALQRPYYLSAYPKHPHAVPAAVRAGVQAMAWLPLGEWEDTAYVLAVARTGPARTAAWRSTDRTLLNAAARSVRAALHQRAAVSAATAAARTDSLTGTGNRRALDVDLAQALDKGQALALTLIDLDGFKALNDVHGHAAGDCALRVFASTLQGTGSAVYRLGGDEFVLLDSSERPASDTEVELQRALRAASGAVGASLGASVGTVHSPEDAQEADVLLALADRRMYEMKRQRHRRSAPLAPCG